MGDIIFAVYNKAVSLVSELHKIQSTRLSFRGYEWIQTKDGPIPKDLVKPDVQLDFT